MRRICVFLLTITILAVAAGCTGKTDSPESVAKAYYEALLAGKYDAAYSLLSKADQKALSQEEFTQWQTLAKQTEEIKSYKLSGVKDAADYKDPVGNTYPKAAIVKVSETDFVHKDQKESSFEYERILVQEDGQWKVDRAETRPMYLHRIYSAYKSIGDQYNSGTGQAKDPAKAIEAYQKALSYENGDINLYFTVALSYLNQKKPADTIVWAEKGMAQTQDKPALSEFMNLKGVALQMQGSSTEALEAFKDAVRLNPLNQNAADNLKLSQE